MKHAWGALVLATLCCIINGASSVFLIMLINHTLTLSHVDYKHFFVLFLTLSLLTLTSRIFSGFLFARISQSIIAKICEYISTCVSSAPLKQIEEYGASSVQSLITEDTTNVSLLFFSLPNVIMYGSVIVGCLIYLLCLSPVVFCLALTLIIIGSCGYIFGGARVLRYLKQTGDAQDRLFSHFNGLFSGAKELKLHIAFTDIFLRKVIKKDIDTIRHYRTRAFSDYAFGIGWLLFLFYLFLGIVVFLPLFISNVNTTGIASYIIIFLFMLMPIDALLNNLPTLNSARVSLKRIEKVMQDLEQENDKEIVSANEYNRLVSHTSCFHPAFFHTIRHHLKLTNLTHSYYREKEDDIFQLGPIDMEFKSGEITFLIGGNGSGKTTLAKLLAGLYIPEKGFITLDGQPITAANRAEYRQLFSAVFTDFYLFDSLPEIAASNTVRDMQANELVAKLHLQYKVRVENGHFSTHKLSQGQRKRLALVIAYLQARPFYLFDEWAADQDPQIKALFYQELLPELAAQGKIVIAITHDDRYFHLADQCLQLESGQLLVKPL